MISLRFEKLLMIGDDMVDKNTLAWRVMLAREEKGLKQIELVDLMNRPPYSIGISTGAYSKIETGDTKTPKHDVLIALSEILDVSIDKLVSGKDDDEHFPIDMFITEEANRIGAMVDKLPPEERARLEEGVRAFYEMFQTVLTQGQQITERDDKIRDLQVQIALLRTEATQLYLERANRIQQSITHDVDVGEK